MDLHFLGTSHGVPSADRYCQSILAQTAQGGILIDAGAPVMDLLLRMDYPLTSLTNSVPDNIWLAYQLNRKSRNDGIIVAFRRDACPDSTCVVKLRGLKPNGTYSLYNYDTNSSEKVKGDAMMKGLKLVLNTPRSSLLLKYKEEN